jgi:hypothetical protein
VAKGAVHCMYCRSADGPGIARHGYVCHRPACQQQAATDRAKAIKRPGQDKMVRERVAK